MAFWQYLHMLTPLSAAMAFSRHWKVGSRSKVSRFFLIFIACASLSRFSSRIVQVGALGQFSPGVRYAFEVY